MRSLCIIVTFLTLASVATAQTDIDGLEAEYDVAMKAWRKELTDARQKKIPRVDWPKSPAGEFYSRFEKTAAESAKGCESAGRALNWMLQNARSLATNQEDVKKRQEHLIKRLMADHVSQPCILAVVNTMRRPPRPQPGEKRDMRREFVEALDTIIAKNKHADVRAAALFNKASCLAGKYMPASEADLVDARKSLVMLKTDHSNSPAAARAESFLYELDHLQIGMAAPDFETEDVEGVKFKLSDYRGKVVLIDFWGFW